MSSLDETTFDASKALLAAALGGLLCVASATCASSDAENKTGSSSSTKTAASGSSSASASSGSHGSSGSSAGTGGATTGSSAGTGGAGTGGTATGGAGTGGTPTNGDTPVPDTECDGGVAPVPQVTSSTMETLTLQQFTSLCASLNGILEIQPHCGGSNACRGLSYDSETETLTEHTCRATNSCAGYSCVVCD